MFKMMKLHKTKTILEKMIYPRPNRGLTADEVDAIARALMEVDTTLENGDGFDTE